MGREYFHWVDLRLIKPMEVVIEKLYLAKNCFFIKMDVFDVNKNLNKGSKRSRAPKTDLVDQKQTGRGRSEAKNAGVKRFSSFIWTFMVTKEK